MDIAGLIYVRPWELELLTYVQLLEVVAMAKAQRKKHAELAAKQKQ